MRRYTGAEARALREAATPGPWEWREFSREHACDALVSPSTVGGMGRGIVLDLGDAEPYDNVHGDCESDHDRALIAATPDLAATVEAMEVERDALRRQVAELTALGVSIHKAHDAGRLAGLSSAAARMRQEAQAASRMRGLSAGVGITIADAFRALADEIERADRATKHAP